MATTINQMSGLSNAVSASSIAPLDEVAVTCESERTTMAINAITPIGMTFRMIATIVVRKMATRPQALGWSPCGTGQSSRVIRTTVVISAGPNRNGTTLLK